MRDMIGTILRHIFQRWVKNYTMAHLKLREPRKWENMDTAQSKEYSKFYDIPERITPIEEELKKYLSPEELQYVLSKKTKTKKKYKQ